MQLVWMGQVRTVRMVTGLYSHCKCSNIYRQKHSAYSIITTTAARFSLPHLHAALHEILPAHHA